MNSYGFYCSCNKDRIQHDIATIDSLPNHSPTKIALQITFEINYKITTVIR